MEAASTDYCRLLRGHSPDTRMADNKLYEALGVSRTASDSEIRRVSTSTDCFIGVGVIFWGNRYVREAEWPAGAAGLLHFPTCRIIYGKLVKIIGVLYNRVESR